jgi:hypothetical protein
MSAFDPKRTLIIRDKFTLARPSIGRLAARRLDRRVRQWRGPMLHSGELIFPVVIVNVPTARLRLFARLRRRFDRHDLLLHSS